MQPLLRTLLETPRRDGGILDVPLDEYLADVQRDDVAAVFTSYARFHRRPSLRTILSDERFQRWTRTAGRRALAPLESELEVVMAIVDEEYILDEDSPPPPKPAPTIREWAAAAGVETRLRDPARMLVDGATYELRNELRWLDCTVGDLVDGAKPEVVRRTISDGLRKSLVEAATKYVRDAGERSLAERAEDARLEALAFRPAGEGTRAFLAAVDDALGRTAKRRSFANGLPTISMEAEPARLELRWVAFGNRGVRRPSRAALLLQDWRVGPLESHLWVASGVGKSDMISDYILRAARRVVADPKHRAHAALIDFLDEPGWRRILEAVDVANGRVHEAEGQVEWQVTSSPLALVPMVRSGGDRAHADVASIAAGSPGATALDEEVAQILGRPHFGYTYLQEAASVARARIHQSLRALVGSDRVVDVRGARLFVSEGRLEIALEDVEGGVGFRFRVGGHPIDTTALRDAIDDTGYLIHVDVAGARVLIAHVGRERAAIVSALTREVAVFPEDARAELLPRLAKLSARMPITIADSLVGESVPADPRPVVRLEREGADGFAIATFIRPVDGGREYPPGEGPPRIVEHVGGRVVFAVRALDEERSRLALLQARLPPPSSDDGWQLSYRGVSRCLELVTALRGAVDANEAIVVWPKSVPRVVGDASFAKLKLSIGARGDWFGVEGKVDAGSGGEIPLETLLAAARARDRFVAVGVDRFITIEDELRQKLLALEELTRTHGRVRGVARAAVPALLEAIGERDALDAFPEFWALVARIDAANTKDAAVPKRFGPILRAYQQDGYRWMSRLAAWGAGACLADEMGLGKTVQALALLVARKAQGPALVVAPTSVGPNWIAEAARFAPGLRCILHRGPERAAALAKVGPGDLVVTSYELLARDEKRLAQVRFGTLILDEAQAIKTGTTARAKAARAIDAEFRLALTGTPVENRLSELYSLMEFLNPGLLGSADDFRARYVIPIERERDASRAASLARLVRPFLLRRKKRDVLAELPARTDVTRVVERGSDERMLYEAARKLALDAASGAEEGARFQILAEIMRLRRLACHPKLFDERSDVPSAKLETFLSLVDELREDGHRALVFSQFTGHLGLVAEALRARRIAFQYLDGSTPLAERTKRVTAFQAGEGTLFLISLKAGGTGLNLTAADTVIHLDPWWNPAVEDQATDRAHRIGQTKPVTVIRLIAQATIEEAVLALHEDKRELAESILEGSAASGKLSISELASLIRQGVVEG